MKHSVKTTILLLGLFLVAQLVGLVLVNMSIKSIDINVETGEPELSHTTTAIGERPDFHGYQSFLYLIFGVGVGTALLLLLIKFRRFKLWKAWFLLAVFLAQSVAFGVFLPQVVALVLAFILALIKIYKPNPWVHNLTEIFMYAGIAVLLVPIFDVFWMFILLLAISLYDAWAVWRSKHMVKMAEFQKKSEVFAGLMVPKSVPHASVSKHAKKLDPAPKPKNMISHAILGGGDIAFPLLFAGAVMESLILSGASNLAAFGEAFIVTIGALLALGFLFFYAKKDRYYPAMPFITAGCVVGWLVMLLVNML